MTVKVTLEFKSVDEAIVALGKLALSVRKVSAAPDVDVPSAPPVAAATPVAAESSKRGRGRPRKKNANSVQPPETISAAPKPVVAAAPLQPQAQSGAEIPAAESASVAAVPSAEDVQTVVQKLFDTKGFNVCAECLARFGVKRAKDLLPEQRGKFMDAAKAILGGEAA